MKHCNSQSVILRIIMSAGVLSAVFFLANACLEPYHLTVNPEESGFLIVDGFLVRNDSTFIKLSRSQPVDNHGNSEAERNATVKIESENGSQYFLIEKGNGLYVAPPLDLGTSQQYRIHIQTDGRGEYVSDYVMLKSSPPLDSVTWKEESSVEAIQFSIYTHDPENNTRYYLWTYDETWKYTSAFTSIYYYENGLMLPREESTELYYCWKTNAPNNVYLNSTIALSEDVVYDFPLLRIPAEPAIGYFSATTVEKKRVFFNWQAIIGPSRPYDPTGYEKCTKEIILLDDISDLALEGNWSPNAMLISLPAYC